MYTLAAANKSKGKPQMMGKEPQIPATQPTGNNSKGASMKRSRNDLPLQSTKKHRRKSLQNVTPVVIEAENNLQTYYEAMSIEVEQPGSDSQDDDEMASGEESNSSSDVSNTPSNGSLPSGDVEDLERQVLGTFAEADTRSYQSLQSTLPVTAHGTLGPPNPGRRNGKVLLHTLQPSGSQMMAPPQMSPPQMSSQVYRPSHFDQQPPISHTNSPSATQYQNVSILRRPSDVQLFHQSSYPQASTCMHPNYQANGFQLGGNPSYDADTYIGGFDSQRPGDHLNASLPSPYLPRFQPQPQMQLPVDMNTTNTTTTETEYTIDYEVPAEEAELPSDLSDPSQVQLHRYAVGSRTDESETAAAGNFVANLGKSSVVVLTLGEDNVVRQTPQALKHATTNRYDIMHIPGRKVVVYCDKLHYVITAPDLCQALKFESSEAYGHPLYYAFITNQTFNFTTAMNAKIGFYSETQLNLRANLMESVPLMALIVKHFKLNTSGPITSLLYDLAALAPCEGQALRVANIVHTHLRMGTHGLLRGYGKYCQSQEPPPTIHVNIAAHELATVANSEVVAPPPVARSNRNCPNDEDYRANCKEVSTLPDKLFGIQKFDVKQLPEIFAFSTCTGPISRGKIAGEDIPLPTKEFDKFANGEYDYADMEANLLKTYIYTVGELNNPLNGFQLKADCLLKLICNKNNKDRKKNWIHFRGVNIHEYFELIGALHNTSHHNVGLIFTDRITSKSPNRIVMLKTGKCVFWIVSAEANSCKTYTPHSNQLIDTELEKQIVKAMRQNTAASLHHGVIVTDTSARLGSKGTKNITQNTAIVTHLVVGYMRGLYGMKMLLKMLATPEMSKLVDMEVGSVKRVLTAVSKVTLFSGTTGRYGLLEPGMDETSWANIQGEKCYE